MRSVIQWIGVAVTMYGLVTLGMVLEFAKLDASPWVFVWFLALFAVVVIVAIVATLMAFGMDLAQQRFGYADAEELDDEPPTTVKQNPASTTPEA
jgi:predicted permease